METDRTSSRNQPTSRLQRPPKAFERYAHQKRWVNWDYHKRPINPTTGQLASPTNPTTWATFQTAIGNSNHVGIMLGGGLACIDLDHCITPDGTLTTEAAQIVALYPNNYIEISPSGHGLHIFGLRAELPGIKRSLGSQAIELYSRARYITITGNIYQHGEISSL